MERHLLKKWNKWSIPTNAIATYDKDYPTEMGLISNIKWLKEKMGDLFLEDLKGNKVIDKFLEYLDWYYKDAQTKGKIPVVVFPPTKPDMKNQMKELIFNFYNKDINWIELLSPIDFELKQTKTLDEREEFLRNHFKTWTSTTSANFSHKDNNLYILVDDIAINGVMLWSMIESIGNIYEPLKKDQYTALVIGLAHNHYDIYPKRIPTETDIIFK